MGASTIVEQAFNRKAAVRRRINMNDQPKDISPNYRIVDNGEMLAVHEVWYDRDGRPIGKSQKPAMFYAVGNSGQAEIIEDLEFALETIRGLPILTVAEIEQATEESIATFDERDARHT